MENSPPSPISPSAIDAEYEEFYADYTWEPLFRKKNKKQIPYLFFNPSNFFLE
jgi:hypothetical protein